MVNHSLNCFPGSNWTFIVFSVKSLTSLKSPKPLKSLKSLKCDQAEGLTAIEIWMLACILFVFGEARHQDSFALT